MLAEAFARVSGFTATVGECSFFDALPQLRRRPVECWSAAVAGCVAASCEPTLSPERTTELAAKLASDSAKFHTLEAMYGEANQLLAESSGTSRWCKKATSYVFHAPEIIENFPNACLLFLIRNPFDLAASHKRRSGLQAVPRMLLGWHRGVTLALQYAERFPANFRIVQYEDLVEPRSGALASAMRFAGVAEPPAVDDIPRVNTADNPYQVEANVKGLTGTFAYRYSAHLKPDEIAAVRALVSDEHLSALYPQLAAEESASSWRLARTLARPAIVTTAATLRATLADPRASWSRAVRRLRS